MTKKTLISIIVVLLFLVAVNFYTKSQAEIEREARLAEITKVEKENEELSQKIDGLQAEVQKLETSAAINVAREFKMKTFHAEYDETYTPRYNSLEDVEAGLGQYATSEEIKYLVMNNVLRYTDQFAKITKSDISVEDISFEVTGADEKKVTLNYDIEIAFDPVEQEDEKKTITNSGQMRIVKTNEGWKVDADIQQYRSLNKKIASFGT